MWCARNRDQSHAKSLNVLERLRPEQELLVTETSEYSSMQALTNINGTGIYPGDICALINPRQERETECMCILANRFCTAQIRSVYLWVRPESEAGPRSWKSHIPTAFKVKKLEWETSSTDSRTSRTTALSGTLQNGERYFVYRMLLYADHSETKSDYRETGSNGGCYMILMNLPPCDRRSRSGSVRYQ